MKKNGLLFKWLSVATIVIVIAVAYNIFDHFYVYSSDVYVEGKVFSISSQVEGQVTAVLVHEGESVNTKQPLITLDPKLYQYAVDQAKAALDTQINAQHHLSQQIASAKQAVDIATLDETHARQQWQKKQRLAGGALTEETVKVAHYNYQRAQANTIKAKDDLAALEAELGENKQVYSAIEQAKATLATAQYHLKQTQINAPNAGVINNIHLSKGDHIAKGNTLFALIAKQPRWLVAQIKESFLADIHPGDRVSVWIDTVSGRLQGHVTSISIGVNRRQASGTVVNSPLPFLEQTEDWISLEQRFPVYIMLDDPPKDLAIGSSASILIHRRSSS